MARKKQPKKSRLRKVILLLVTPFIVWFLAFLLWFYWHDLRRWFANGEDPRRQPPPKAARPSVKEEQRERPAPQPQEKISEEDRRKLDDILKRRN
jgi:hypothetical protein